MANPIAQKIADQFVAVLQKVLSPEYLAEIDRRNKIYDPTSCATHDFCDANVYMEQAFKDVGVETFEGEHMPDSVVELWNEAWGIAKARGFSNVVAAA